MSSAFYNVDLGVFPTPIKLCFDQAGLDKILETYGIDKKIKVFEYGAAETHYLTRNSHGIVIVMFDLADYGDDKAYLNGIIAHEAYHVACRVFNNINERQKDVGEETMAYTIERIFRQIASAVDTEMEKRNVRKTGRGVPKQTGKRARRTVV